jgi:nucleosome binding factor SPN SPT16 subunit
VAGTKISSAYNSTIEYIKSKNQNLASQIHTNFGFGIGHALKEEELVINANNNLTIAPGMVFHVRITLKDVDEMGPIALADTVLVQSNEESKILTESIPRKYKHISYTIDESDKSDDDDIMANG